MTNAFLKAVTSYDAKTWNGAVSHSTSGDAILDYFSKCGSYQNRSGAEVAADMGSIFGADPLKALKTVFYNRLITRKPKDVDTVQRGQGQKDEFVKSIAWLENNRPDLVYNNLHLIPVIGCWKDLWYDSAATGFYHYIDTSKVYPFVAAAMENKDSCSLVAKFLPKIRSQANTKNDRHRRLNAWSRGLCSYLGWTERQYRKFKSDPSHSAHNFQRVMCDGDWQKLSFNGIPGRALFKMLSQSGRDKNNVIGRHNLEAKYLDWIKNQPVAKFTGYPFELFKAATNERRSLAQSYTYNSQFENMLKTARQDVNPELLDGGVLCALDTSGSMTWDQIGNGFQPYHVCLGLGIFFSSLIEGHFKDHVVSFDARAQFHKLQGNFCEKADQIVRCGGWGNTNFQSVIDSIVKQRKDHPSIPIEDFPKILLVVSDMQFDCSGRKKKTNYEVAMQKLADVGLPKMTIIWWQVNGVKTSDVPSKMDDEGTVLISGFDGSIVSQILYAKDVVDDVTGEKRKANPLEIMNQCLDQEVLNRLVC